MTRSQTWEVRCIACGEIRWPYLPEKPAPYTCGRCASVPPEKREGRRAAAQQRASHRKTGSTVSPLASGATISPEVES